MSRLCYEHDVRLSVCDAGGLWSHRATNNCKLPYDKIGRCLGYLPWPPKPTRIVISRVSWILLRKTRIWKICEFWRLWRQFNLCLQRLACCAISSPVDWASCSTHLIFISKVTLRVPKKEPFGITGGGSWSDYSCRNSLTGPVLLNSTIVGYISGTDHICTCVLCCSEHTTQCNARATPVGAATHRIQCERACILSWVYT